MNTAAISQKLPRYLGIAVAYTDEFKAELDSRHAAYKSGKEKTVTTAESKRRIQKLLKTKRKQ